MKIQTTLAAAGALLLLTPLEAQIFETYSFSPNLTIPDGNATGVRDVRTISSAGLSITDLKVSLNISGDFNGDLFLYLRHDSGYSVLLNRPGRSASDSFGYGDSGFSITLRDDAAHDIHNYRDFSSPSSGVALSGAWQPDARITDPAAVLASDTRSAFLNSFQGVNPNGQWTLFAADLQNGGISQVQNWELQMTVVPEPREIALAAGAALTAFAFIRRRLRKK